MRVSLSEYLKRSFLSWGAGVIDGEGCLSIRRRSPGAKSRPQERSYVYRLEITVKMTHKPTIEALKSVFGCGTITREMPGRLNKKVAWRWTVSGKKDVSHIIKSTLPVLVTKRDEAMTILRFLGEDTVTVARRNGVLPETEKIRSHAYKKMQALKLREWKR